MDYTENIIHKVWRKGKIDEYNILNNFRKDTCGAWIERIEYENVKSSYGWQIAKIDQDLDSHDITNLYPVHSKNNTMNQDGTTFCNVTSIGTINVEKL